jgi:hypothetical protein
VRNCVAIVVPLTNHTVDGDIRSSATEIHESSLVRYPPRGGGDTRIMAPFDVPSPIRKNHSTEITEELVILVDFVRPELPE